MLAERANAIISTQQTEIWESFGTLSPLIAANNI